jgi:membrane dipeptidase
MLRPSLILAVSALTLLPSPSSAQADPHLERALRVLATTPLVDGHNDLPWAIRQSDAAPKDVHAEAHDLRARTTFHTDIPRMLEGRVGAQYWSVYIPFGSVEYGAAMTQLEQIDIAHQIIAKYPDVFELALNASDVERIFAAGRIASILGMEGGHAIENSLGALGRSTSSVSGT